MSRGSDRRQETRDRISVLDSIRGHESTVAHSFNHTGGQCPKCGCQQHAMFFCAPNIPELPKLRLCELEGEHLHRMCNACHYPWIERPLDQAMLSEKIGLIVAESELASALSVILDRTDGAELDHQLVSSRRGWLIQFDRDPVRRTLVLKTRPPDPQVGTPQHPTPQDVPEGAQG